MALFSFPNKWFAWFQYIAFVIKVVALVMFLIVDFAIIMGAAAEGQFHDGKTWRENPLFRNGFAVSLLPSGLLQQRLPPILTIISSRYSQMPVFSLSGRVAIKSSSAF